MVATFWIRGYRAAIIPTSKTYIHNYKHSGPKRVYDEKDVVITLGPFPSKDEAVTAAEEKIKGLVESSSNNALDKLDSGAIID